VAGMVGLFTSTTTLTSALVVSSMIQDTSVLIQLSDIWKDLINMGVDGLDTAGMRKKVYALLKSIVVSPKLATTLMMMLQLSHHSSVSSALNKRLGS
jgi:hypothetical protein